MAENDDIAETSQAVTTLNALGDGGFVHGDDLDTSAINPALEGQNDNQDFAAPVPLSDDRILDIQRLIDVMDHHLTCEAAWHGGVPPEHTVHTCIYVHNPPSTLHSHARLHSFCDVTRKIVDDVAQVRKLDKDFFNAKGDRNILAKLQNVDEEICLQLKACKTPLSKKSLLEDVEPLQTNPNLEGFYRAVLCRLRFRKHFCHMLSSLRKRKGKGFDLARIHIESCLLELKSMLKSEELLQQDRAELNKTTASGSQPVGFLNPSSIIDLCNWKEAVNCFQKLLDDLEIICSNPLSPVLENAVQFLNDFQKRKPLEFVSAYIQLLVVQDEGLYGRGEPIFVIICNAALLPMEANYSDIQRLTSVKKLGTLLIELLRVLCTDFESQRGELAGKILDWRQILQELDFGYRFNLEDYNTRFPSDQYKINKQAYNLIRLWVEEQQLWIALRYLLLGFHTDAYSPNDYCMVYCYIYMISMKLGEKIMQKIKLKNVPVTQTARRNARTEKGGSAYNMNEESEVPHQVMLLRCYTHVVQDLLLVLGVLRFKHKLFIGEGEEEMFTLNFSALEDIGGISYERFENWISISASNFSDDFIAGYIPCKALEIARELKVKYDEVNDEVRSEEVEQLMNVTVSNEKTVKSLRQLGTLDESTKFSFEFDQHPYFAVVTMDGPADLQNLQQLNINAP